VAIGWEPSPTSAAGSAKCRRGCCEYTHGRPIPRRAGRSLGEARKKTVYLLPCRHRAEIGSKCYLGPCDPAGTYVGMEWPGLRRIHRLRLRRPLAQAAAIPCPPPIHPTANDIRSCEGQPWKCATSRPAIPENQIGWCSSIMRNGRRRGPALERRIGQTHSRSRGRARHRSTHVVVPAPVHAASICFDPG